MDQGSRQNVIRKAKQPNNKNILLKIVKRAAPPCKYCPSFCDCDYPDCKCPPPTPKPGCVCKLRPKPECTGCDY